VLSDAVGRWSDAGGSYPLAELVREGFDLLEFGLPTRAAPSAVGA
jgi:hypothetical protein